MYQHRHVHDIYLLLITLYLAEACERECSRRRWEWEHRGWAQSQEMVILTFMFHELTVIKAPKNSDIGTANIPHNNIINSLHEWWMCHAKPRCSSKHCFINPVDASHFPLSCSHFDVWGSAMVCTYMTHWSDTYTNCTTLHIAQRSSHSNLGHTTEPPYVQCHLQQSSQSNKSTTQNHQHGNSSNGSAPVFNFNILNDVFHIFKPPTAVPVVPVQGNAPALSALCYWKFNLCWSMFQVPNFLLMNSAGCTAWLMVFKTNLMRMVIQVPTPSHMQNRKISKKQGWKLVRLHS